MFINTSHCVSMLQNHGLLWILVPSRQPPPFSCTPSILVSEAHLASATPLPQSLHAYHMYFIQPENIFTKLWLNFQKIQIVVGLASPTPAVSADLLLASVMRLGGGCQTLNITEMKFSWWGWSQAYYCSDYGASWLSSLVSMALLEHKKHRLLCKIYLN